MKETPIRLFLVPDDQDRYYPVDDAMLAAMGITLEKFIDCCEEGQGAWHEIHLNPIREALFTEARRAALLPDENQGFRLDPTLLARHTIAKLVESWSGPGFADVTPEDYGGTATRKGLLPVTSDRIYNEISARAYPSITSHPAFTKALLARRPGSEAKTEGTPPESPS